MSANVIPINNYSPDSTVPTWHQTAIDAVPLAIKTIVDILNDPKSSLSLRLRAAAMILKLALPPAPKPPRAAPAPAPAKPAKLEIVHNSAQPANTTFRREQAKIGRNNLCPCGSGRKYKMCCLGRTGPFAKLPVE